MRTTMFGGLMTLFATASGAPFHFEYEGAEDDTVVPVSGNPYYDSTSNAWTNERTLTRTERRAGKVTGTTAMEVAPDGKSFTAKGQRLTPDGVNYVTSTRPPNSLPSGLATGRLMNFDACRSKLEHSKVAMASPGGRPPGDARSRTAGPLVLVHFEFGTVTQSDGRQRERRQSTVSRVGIESRQRQRS